MVAFLQASFWWPPKSSSHLTSCSSLCGADIPSFSVDPSPLERCGLNIHIISKETWGMLRRGVCAQPAWSLLPGGPGKTRILTQEVWDAAWDSAFLMSFWSLR